MTQDEALKMALDALETELSIDWTNDDQLNASAEKMYEAMQAIKKALLQPEQEPVAWHEIVLNQKQFLEKMEWLLAKTAAPSQRTWVGLTDEEREEIALEVPIDAVLITEAKLKEKNT